MTRNCDGRRPTSADSRPATRNRADGEPERRPAAEEVACSLGMETGTATRTSSSRHCSLSFRDIRSFVALLLPPTSCRERARYVDQLTHGRLRTCSSRSASARPDGPSTTGDPSDPEADHPDEADGGVSGVVADIVRVIRASGLPNETNAMFTNIEGEWDEVMAVVKQAVDVAAAHYPRVGLVLKADIRPGYDGQLAAKVERVEEHLRDG